MNATALHPGDQVRLKSGGSWTGQLAPQGSGAPGNPIVIGSYGSGAKPVLAGQGLVGATVLLSNEHDVTVDGLEVTNTTGQPKSATSPVTVGIELYGKDAGTLADLTVQNNYVHDTDSATGNYSSDPAAGGIIYIIRGNTTPTRFDHLTIQDNEVADSGSYGISGVSTWMVRDGWTSLWDFLGIPTTEFAAYYPSTALTIRGNRVHDISAGGIAPLVISGALIEHNTVQRTSVGHGNAAIWWADADDTTVQYNDVSQTPMIAGDTDASAFDADASTYGSLVQYNFSHDNDGGFFESVAAYNGAAQAVVRYNVSQNDGQGTDDSGTYAAPLKFYSLTGHVDVLNNTIWTTAGTTAPSAKMVWLQSSSATGVTLSGNIFGNAAELPYTNSGSSGAITYTHNLYYPGQPRPADSSPVVGDPKLTAPGTATAITDLSGYALGAGSAAASAGVPNAEAGGRDAVGGAVPSSNPDLGAVQSTGAVTPTVSMSSAAGALGAIDYTYPTAQTFSSVALGEVNGANGANQGPMNVTVQTWNGSRWITQSARIALGWAATGPGLGEYRSLDLPAPVTTTAVRIVVNAADSAWGSLTSPDLRLGDYVLDAGSSSIGALSARWAGDLSDLVPTTTWSSPTSGYSFPFDLDRTFRQPRSVRQVAISAWFGQGQGPTDVTIQTWNGSGWVTQAADQTLSWAHNSSVVDTDVVTLPAAVTTTGLRVVVNAANTTWGNVAVNEIAVS
ncbi:right-handed parallel beta-helix repeat-containing protein [Catenulispora sp. NF23]|uniref:right-handed parallel beta-helix repeat-containing protein n=1 Tax=Catenulispora pinistramenti TaxID=2705254 RepID=UPI001BA6EA70|nr:right-handed parallel beta-helix repeat-containing protein [Catenulispora pinistramenti]MBS2538582.1 right-handed parallel beta-helix repeat-containing protein [Catenulispora pinistramenti]